MNLRMTHAGTDAKQMMKIAEKDYLGIFPWASYSPESSKKKNTHKITAASSFFTISLLIASYLYLYRKIGH